MYDWIITFHVSTSETGFPLPPLVLCSREPILHSAFICSHPGMSAHKNKSRKPHKARLQCSCQADIINTSSICHVSCRGTVRCTALGTLRVFWLRPHDNYIYQAMFFFYFGMKLEILASCASNGSIPFFF